MQFPTTTQIGTLSVEQNKVLRNTYMMLALTMIPTVIGAVALSCLTGYALAVYKFRSNLLVFFMFAMVKAFVPRYRYDQLMRLGWKVFLPISLFMVVAVAGVLQYTGWQPGH